MKRLLCWLLGHDRMTTRARQRVCLRCGTRETLRHYGSVMGWEEVTQTAGRASKA
jgi:hypothetical protein